MIDADESFIKDELTLPIDWEKSGRMSLLGNFANSDETLMDERKNMKTTPNQPYSSMPDLSSLPPNFRVAGPSSVTSADGAPRNLTPVGRPMSLKEYEQQLNDLKKENFNLKLRIFYLETKLPKIEGFSGEDLMKKNLNLELELETLKNETERKEKILQEITLNAKRIQANHVRELEECRQEAEDAGVKDRQELIRCSSHLTAMRCQFEDVGKILMELEAENRRLKEIIDNNPANHFSESDTDVSLLSEKERLIISLKTQLVQLERQMSEEKHKFDENLLVKEQLISNKSEENDSIRRELQIELENGLKRDKTIQGLLKTIEKFSKPKADADDFTLAGVSALTDPSLMFVDEPADQEKEMLKRKLVAAETYNANLYDRIRRVADCLLQFSESLDGDIGSTLFAMSTDLSKLQDSLGDVTNTFLVEENDGKFRLELLEKEEKISDLIQMLSEKENVESELSRELMETKEKLKELTKILKEKEILESKLSRELSERVEKLNDLDKILEEKESVELKYRRELSEMNEKLVQCEKNLKEKENVESKFSRKMSEMDDELKDLVTILKEKESVESKHRGECADMNEKLHQLQTILNEKENVESNLTRELDKMNEKLDALVKNLNHKEMSIGDLSQKNEKLERYGKLLKMKYRKLESKFRSTNEAGEPKENEFKEKPCRSADEVDALLLNEQERNVDLDSIVKQLEENNKTLAQRLCDHELVDERMKQKTVEMKKTLKMKEKKIRKKDENSAEI